MIKNNLFFKGLTAFILSIIFISVVSLVQAAPIAYDIPTPRLTPVDKYQYSNGVMLEIDRQLTNTSQYDNVSLTPLSVRYGYSQSITLGTEIKYSSNSFDNNNFYSDNGFEALLMSGQYQFNKNFGSIIKAGWGANDVLPYGGDGMQLSFEAPARFQLGPGDIVGTIGYTAQNGQINGQSSWQSYSHYGIGYQYKANSLLTIRTELVGHKSPLHINSEKTKDMLAVNVIPTFSTSNTEITPKMKIGIADGSPDIALGIFYSMPFTEMSAKQQKKRRKEDKTKNKKQDNKTAQETSYDTEATADSLQKTVNNEKNNHDTAPILAPERFIKKVDDIKSINQWDTSKAKIKTKQKRVKSGTGVVKNKKLATKSDTPSTVATSVSDTSVERSNNKAKGFLHLIKKGQSAYQNNNLDRAIKSYGTALQKKRNGPQAAAAYSDLASLYYRKNDFAKAIHYYRKSLAILPTDSKTRLFLGLTYYKLKKYDRALTQINQAIVEADDRTVRQKAKKWFTKVKNIEK